VIDVHLRIDEYLVSVPVPPVTSITKVIDCRPIQKADDGILQKVAHDFEGLLETQRVEKTMTIALALALKK
jgi:hypothetical protein